MILIYTACCLGLAKKKSKSQLRGIPSIAFHIEPPAIQGPLSSGFGSFLNMRNNSESGFTNSFRLCLCIGNYSFVSQRSEATLTGDFPVIGCEKPAPSTTGYCVPLSIDVMCFDFHTSNIPSLPFIGWNFKTLAFFNTNP